MRDCILDVDCRHLEVTGRKDIRLGPDIDTPERRPVQIGHLNKGGQGERIYSVLGCAITIAANSGGVGSKTGLYLVNGRVRRLHVEEARCVMGFPPGHVVSDGTQGYKQLGNAVIPGMVGRVFDGIGRVSR